MANPIGQKKLAVTNAEIIGTCVDSPINLESATNGQWLCCDGRDILRGSYPELAKYFPIPIFTSTARTLNAAPVLNAIAADSTNFLCPGAAGTSPLQASADGITWSTSATWTAATSPAAIINAGTRYVMAGAGGDLAQPYVSTIDQTAANAVAKANWTATTGGTTPTTNNIQGLAYSPTANAGAGRTVLVRNGSLSTAAGLFYMNDGATAWNACSGGSTASHFAVCWTGQKFIVTDATTGNRIKTSNDGATWVDQYIPFKNGGTASVASDGNGTVVMYTTSVLLGMNTTGVGVLVSKDHGATWRFISWTTNDKWSSNGTIQYVNGMFSCSQSTMQTLLSVDGISWFNEQVSNRGKAWEGAGAGDLSVWAYKAGVYCGISTTTTALTATGDNSKFRLPMVATMTGSVPLNQLAVGLTYIKARSN